jgi:AraC-like DNA-binding protein
MPPISADSETNRLAEHLFKHFCQCLERMSQNRMPQDNTLPRVNLTSRLQRLGVQYEKHATHLSLSQYYQLLEDVAPTLQESGFFLRLGNAFDITDAGVLGYASLSVENLRQSWELTSQRSRLYPHPISGQRRIEHERVIIELTTPARSSIDPRYLQEEWLASTWKWMCQRLPQVTDSRDLQLKLNYPAPIYQSLYKKIFPGSVLFDQTRTEMSFPESWYDTPFPSANPATAELCQQQCQLIIAQLDSQTDLVDQIRRALLLSPQRQFPSLASIAEQCQLPAYTIHRRLKKTGTSYRHIVNEVRMKLAKDYVENTALPLQEVSYLLGYDYPANFFRAFKKWFNCTADQCRQSSQNDR